MALTEKQIITALKNKGGFIGKAAKDLNVSYQAIWMRINKSEKLKEVHKSILEEYLDLAESKLITLIKEGNLGAICFYLKCKGKDRGYVERVSNTLDGDLNMTIRWMKDGDSNPLQAS